MVCSASSINSPRPLIEVYSDSEEKTSRRHKNGANKTTPLIKPAPAVAPIVMSNDLRSSGFCQYNHTASGTSTRAPASQADREKLTTIPAAIIHQTMRPHQVLTCGRPRIKPTVRKPPNTLG